MKMTTSPYDMRNSYSDIKKPINMPVVTSLVGHVAALLVIIFGIPFIAKNPAVLYEPVTVELIGAREAQEELDKVQENQMPEPPSLVRQAPTMIDEAPPDILPEKLVKEEVLNDPPPAEVPLPSDVPDDNAEIIKDEPVKSITPVALPLRKPKPPEETEKPKAIEKKPTKSFDSLLKNLAINDPAPTPVQSQTEIQPTSSSIASNSSPLSMGERSAIQGQIAACWNIRGGAKYAENLAVEIHLVMNSDRTVRDANIVNQGRYNRDPAFRAAADAALRAVRNPRCSPLNLPPEKYDQWKSMTLNFDPKDLL